MGRITQVSGKHLGELHLPSHCPRCVWLKLHLEYRLPYQIFPGIFSSIDSYTKRLIEQVFDEGGQPDWLAGLGRVSGYVPPPSFHSFQALDAGTGIRLTGAADAIFVRPDGTHLIADYKTARRTPGQDALRPLYEAQLNAYAWIAERCGLGPVSGLALIYMEPMTAERDVVDPANRRANGFAMGFKADVEPVEMDDALVPRLLRQARALVDQSPLPPPTAGCKDCERAARLAALVSV